MTKKKQGAKQVKDEKPELTMRDIKRYVGIAGIVFLVLALLMDMYASVMMLIAGVCVYVGLTNNFELRRKVEK